MNPWDVWRDDTADRGECPERITDRRPCVAMYKSFATSAGKDTDAGSAFQEWIGLVVCPRLGWGRESVIAFRMDRIQRGCALDTRADAHKDESWQALLGEQHGRDSPDRRTDDSPRSRVSTHPGRGLAQLRVRWVCRHQRP